MAFLENEKFDFYSQTVLKSYNLNESMRYQLSTLENLDTFTRTHSENVANLTCRICEYLHLKPYYTSYATVCAYLHDIGKQFIPSKILQKPGKLTDEEYEIIKSHTKLGYDLCMKDPLLRDYSDGALYHHEALNGSGYPNGLTKKEIPLTGQIIRVADEYDALVTKRCYTTHVNISKTLEDLLADTEPSKRIIAFDFLSENTRKGKNNPKVLKALFKVVVDDTLFEISSICNYCDFLKDKIKRYEDIDKYYTQMQNAKTEKEKNYFKEGVEFLLKKR